MKNSYRKTMLLMIIMTTMKTTVIVIVTITIMIITIDAVKSLQYLDICEILGPRRYKCSHSSKEQHPRKRECCWRRPGGGGDGACQGQASA